VAIPVGFLACWLGRLLRRERPTAHSFEELQVRPQTGLEAERAPPPRAEPSPMEAGVKHASANKR